MIDIHFDSLKALSEAKVGYESAEFLESLIKETGLEGFNVAFSPTTVKELTTPEDYNSTIRNHVAEMAFRGVSEDEVHIHEIPFNVKVVGNPSFQQISDGFIPVIFNDGKMYSDQLEPKEAFDFQSHLDETRTIFVVPSPNIPLQAAA